MGHRISDEDWEAFEKLTFQALLAVFNLTANDRNQLTQRKKDGGFWCPLTGVTLQVSEPPADIATAVSAGDFFLSHEPLVVD